MSLSIVFMGTPDFSVPCLRALAESQHTVMAVFTQPDKPKGRGYKMIPTPVKQAAQEYDIPVYQPQSLRKGEDAQHIGSSWLLQKAQGDKICCLTDKDSTQAGQGNGDKKACPEGGGGGFFIPGSFFGDDL